MAKTLAYYGKCINLESLDGFEELLDLKLRKIDHLIASIGSRMADHNQGVDMALWQ